MVITAHSADVPRVIDTTAFFEARGTEVQALQRSLDAQQADGAGITQTGARRRTNSHRRYKHPHRRNVKLQRAGAEALAAGATASEVAASRPTCRTMRRQPSRLRAALQKCCAAEPGTANSLPRKLETHLWHVKRMSMQQRWGHVLPEGAVGKGHNSRHWLHTLHTGAVLHDNSYWRPVQLAGSQPAVLALLQAHMEPGTAAALLVGDGPWRERSVMLHQPAQWPAGAIAPAWALLLPAGRTFAAAAADVAANSGVATSSGAAPISHVHLWLWLHPAAYEEVLQALRVEAESRAAESSGGDSVRVLPLGAHLRRLELRGPQSAAAVAALLPQLASAAERPAPDGTVRACLLQDPRLRRGAHKDAAETPAVLDGAATASSRTGKGHPAQPMPQGAIVTTSGNTALPQFWEQPAALAPPYSQHQVDQWRQQRRLAELGLAEAPGAEPKQSTRSEAATEGEAGSCPALLVRRRTFGAAAAGFSLILPAGWVGPVWQALLQQGAKPVGLREWRWVAVDQGCAFFPSDFPDTAAGGAEAVSDAAQAAQAASRAVKAKQPAYQVPDWRALGRPSGANPEAAGTEAAAVIPETAGSPADGRHVDATADAGPMEVDSSEARPFVAAQQASTEVAATGRQAPPEEGPPGQAASGLLPHGWWVARTAAAVRRPPSAEQQGTLADDAAAARNRLGGSLVRVRIKMTERGVAAAGAAILAPLSAGAAADSPDAVRLVGFVTTPLPRGACARAGATALCSASLFARELATPEDGTSNGVGRPVQVAVVHPATGEHLAAEAVVALAGRAGDSCL